MKKNESMENNALHQLFVDGLKDLLWAEEHLSKSLTKMIKGATSEELKKTLGDHQKETDEHINRLKQVFESIGEKAQSVKCEAMEGLLKEAEELLKDSDKGTLVRDAALIAGAQKIEHYEIASYGTLATYAKLMGHSKAKQLLGKTLDEEKSADEKLTEIAESFVNESAMNEEI